MNPPSNPVVQLPLRALATLYRAALKLRDRHYDRPGSIRRASLPVLSVGNLTVGGTGKTPLVAWLARGLADAGHRPAVVTRGYGGTAGRGPLVLSRGDGPVRPVTECGDEPYLLASTLEGVHVVVGSDRWAGAEAAAGQGCDVVILDDGFQHRRLARNLDLVLLDAGSPFGNGRLLPAGPLREPPSALARADLLLLTRCAADHDLADFERTVRIHNPEAPVLAAGHRRLGFFAGETGPVAPPRRALVFCAIGNPGRFRADVEAEGVEVVAFLSRRDHHRFGERELLGLQSRAASADAVLVTTEKDRVRLPDPRDPADAPSLLTLRIEAEVFRPEPLHAAVRRALEKEPRR